MESASQYYRDRYGVNTYYDPRAEPSQAYLKHITSVSSPGFKYHGRVTRTTIYKNVSTEPNRTILPFLINNTNEHFKEFTLNHRQCQPTVDSGYVAIQHYSKRTPKGVSGVALSFCEEFLHHMFYQSCINSSTLPWEDVARHLNKKTSCGYPFSSVNYFHSKQAFFDLKNWQENLNELEKIALSDPHFRIFWQVSQKFEMRPVEKLDLPIQKIRVFLSAPVDFVMLQNKYCLDFNNKFMSAYKNTFSKVGMSKYRRGWDQLYNSFGDKNSVLGIDGEKFDTTISSILTNIIRDFRIHCTDPRLKIEEITQIMEFIYDNIQNAMLVLEHGDVVTKEVGNTTGQANTIIDNSMASIIAIVYMYHERCIALGVTPSPGHLMQLIHAIVLGDDVVIGLRPIDLGFLNFTIMDKYYSQLGMKITRESAEHTTLDNCEFLSTKFIKDRNGFVLPLMNRNKMFSSLMIGDSNPDPRWVLLRVYAFRIECWADKSFINLLLDFEIWLLQRFSKLMVGEMYVGKFDQIVTMSDVMSTRLTDAELNFLYYGYESQTDRDLFGLATKLSALLNLENL